VVEKPRTVTTKDGIKKVTHEGNFEKSSRQMEHAILIECLNQLMPALEENDILLKVVVDGDLETRKTLEGVGAVHQIFSDLKHLSKNIRKKLSKFIIFFMTIYIKHIYNYLFSACK